MFRHVEEYQVRLKFRMPDGDVYERDAGVACTSLESAETYADDWFVPVVGQTVLQMCGDPSQLPASHHAHQLVEVSVYCDDELSDVLHTLLDYTSMPVIPDVPAFSWAMS